MGTSGYKREHGLTVAQENAIDALIVGATDREAAEAAGIHRVTVTKWRNHDPYFQAELNRRRKEIWSASKDRLRALLPRALDRLETELMDGKDGCRVALELLRIVGLDSGAAKNPLGAQDIGSTEPRAIIDAIAKARRPDPLAALIDGEPVTESERAQVEREIATSLAAA